MKKGFSVVELMCVIAIIAILSAILSGVWRSTPPIAVAAFFVGNESDEPSFYQEFETCNAATNYVNTIHKLPNAAHITVIKVYQKDADKNPCVIEGTMPMNTSAVRAIIREQND